MERIELTPAEFDQLEAALNEPAKVLPRLAQLLNNKDDEYGTNE